MPASDYGAHDPEFSDEQIEQCARIVGAVRELNDKIIRLSGSVADLSAAADRIEALSAALEGVTGDRAMETFRFQFDAADPNGVMPFNPATGPFNPVAPEMRMFLEGDKLVAEFAFSPRYESGPDAVQGGMVAAFYDQLLAFVVMAAGKTGFTASLKVDYLKPTPIEQNLRFEGWVESIDGKKYDVRGCCWLGDEKLTEASGLVIGAYDLPRVDSSAR